MNNIVTMNNFGLPVTTSIAIADGVGNPHKSVLQLIRQNASDLEDFGGVAFEMRPFDTAGGVQNREIALLNEQQSTLLLTYMRNNDVVRAFKKRLVKAFFELTKQRQAPSVENMSRMEILKLAMQSEEERIRLEQEKQALQSQIVEAAPHVAFAKQVEASHDAISVAQAAKILGTGQKRLFAFLRQIGWITRINEPYQVKIEAGLLDVKIGSWEHPEQGLQRSVTTLITGKGLAKIQQLWAQRNVNEEFSA